MSAAASLTMQDIAQLGQVTRQAVTNWRRRPRLQGRFLPFPDPISTIGGVERFDRDQIVGWLQGSGRGNNQEARDDAPGLAVPDGLTCADVVTLLALRAAGGGCLTGRTAAELAELAEVVDPDDRFLLAEVRSIAPPPALAEYVDAVMDASYGPADALDRVYASRLARGLGERGLSADLTELLTAVTAACGEHLAADSAALDPRVDLSTARRLAAGFAGVNLAGTGPSERALLRHLALDEVERLDSHAPTVRVLSVVGHPDSDALDEVDALALDLQHADLAVVLGSSAVFCDALRGEQARRRAETLALGHLVMAIRLPRGHWKAAYRQSLALWILQGDANVDRIVVADLSSDTIDLGDLVSDVTGALQHTGARAFRYGRAVERSELRGRRPIVPLGVRALRLGGSAAIGHRDRITAASLLTSERLRGYDVAVGVAPPTTVIAPRSLGEVVASRRMQMLSGSRIDLAHADAAGTVPVVTADRATDGFALDPVDAVRLYGHARRTLPNDVIFTERPRPQARVDGLGRALVKSPSRILRLAEGVGIGPHALAAVINELPDDAGEWRTWSIPTLDPGEIEALERTLQEAAAHVAELRRREAAMDDLITNLIQGVAAGAVTLGPSTTTTRAG